MSVTPVIYLDHAATSWPKPDSVLKGIVDFMGGVVANAGRSGHQASVESARLVFQVREQLARMLGIENSENLIFTRGTTEGLNLVLKGFLGDGDKVLVSPMEHNALMRPLMRLAMDRGVSYEILPADKFGRVDISASRPLLTQGPWKLICIAHASNVNGVIQDIARIRASFPDIPILVDAAQTAGVIPIDIGAMGIDFLACSGHKGLLGPTGIGALYISPDYPIPPLIEGGTGSDSESLDQPEFRPDRYESGTVNLHGLAGLRGGLEYLASEGLTGKHKVEMTSILLDGMKKIPGITVYTPDDNTALMVSFTIDGMYPDQVAMSLEEGYGILCRPGLDCAPMAHEHLGTVPSGTARLSPGYGNTIEDIEIAIEAVSEIARDALQ